MSLADFTNIEGISRRLYVVTEELSAMAPLYAKAKQIREFDSDRRKRTLATFVVGFLNLGKSAADAEHRARASEPYGEAMRACGADLVHAEQTIAEWTAKQAQFEALRSLLSVQRTIMNSL
jgi:hypothetical protein